MVILNILQPTPNSWNIYFVYEKTFILFMRKAAMSDFEKKIKNKKSFDPVNKTKSLFFTYQASLLL